MFSICDKLTSLLNLDTFSYEREKKTIKSVCVEGVKSKRLGGKQKKRLNFINLPDTRGKKRIFRFSAFLPSLRDVKATPSVSKAEMGISKTAGLKCFILLFFPSSLRCGSLLLETGASKWRLVTVAPARVVVRMRAALTHYAHLGGSSYCGFMYPTA